MNKEFAFTELQLIQKSGLKCFGADKLKNKQRKLTQEKRKLTIKLCDLITVCMRWYEKEEGNERETNPL